VNRLNITMILGLPIAMLAYLYANRFISIPVVHQIMRFIVFSVFGSAVSFWHV